MSGIKHTIEMTKAEYEGLTALATLGKYAINGRFGRSLKVQPERAVEFEAAHAWIERQVPLFDTLDDDDGS